MSVVLTVSNRKGGSGKTTTAVNLAAEWAARGARTLLVDLDTQGHAGLGVGVTAGRGEPTAHDIFCDPAADLVRAIRPTGFANLSVAPADALFDSIGRDRDLTILAGQLHRPRLAGAFDVVILDTPPSLDLALMNAMAAADGVVIPLVPHALSAEGVRQLVRLFYRIVTTVNPTLRLLGLVPVMVNPRVTHHRGVLDDLTRQFGAHRMLPGIRADIRLAEAFATGRPLRALAPKSRGVLDYYLLANELTTILPWPQPPSTAAMRQENDLCQNES